MIGIVDADSIAYVLGWRYKDSLETDIQYPVNNLLRDWLEGARCTHYVCLLGANYNFRKKLNTRRPYKGDRVKADWLKYWEPKVREVLIEQSGAVYYEGLEADDLVGIYHYSMSKEYDCTIISPDKDLKQIAGRHYNPNRQTTSIVSTVEAQINLHTQWMIGDSTDNIIGIERFGEKTAEKLLKDVTEVEEMEAIVEAQYRKKYGDNYLYPMLETYVLVKMHEVHPEALSLMINNTNLVTDAGRKHYHPR